MIIVPSADKQRYLYALHQSDIAVGERPAQGATATIEQIRPFANYLERCAQQALHIAINAAQGVGNGEWTMWQGAPTCLP
jgi:hypothetical protein